MSLKLFRYPGSKTTFLPTILPIINEVDGDLFVEPFLGSGAVLLNYQKCENKIGNDLNSYIIRIWKSIIEVDWEYFKNFYDENIKRFGDWSNNKEIFYKFRNYGNQKWHKSDTLDEGLFYLIMTNSCINNMCRFGG